jgi:hypothetical protein
MNAYRHLPAGHHHCYTLSSGRYKGLQALLILAACGGLFLTWQVIARWFPAWLEPAPGGTLPTGRYTILVVAIGMVLAHEGIHALAAWRITGRWPAVGVTPLGVYVNLSGWYLSRRAMLVIALLPFVLLTLLGTAAVWLLPAAFTRAGVWFVLLNAAGAINDLALAAWVFFQPDSALVHNGGRDAVIYRPEEVDPSRHGLRDRVRVVLERTLVKP